MKSDSSVASSQASASEGPVNSYHSNRASVSKEKVPPVMRVFIAYEDERVTMDISPMDRVEDVRERVREAFAIGPDEGPAGVEMQEKKNLTLTYAGADLDNDWYFTDVGIASGSTVKAVLRDEIKPTIYIYSVFNDELIPIVQSINFCQMTVGEFRGIASRKTGLPVGVFRLLNQESTEMYDCHTLDDYGVELGQTVNLEIWDGWSDFLNLAMMGFASHMMDNLSSDEVVARYQMKVALYVAAHYGHVDLAVSMLRLGIRADEAVGTHPIRQWCRTMEAHIDSRKAPVHEAAETGQLGVLRSFVHNNVCNVLAKDGNGLTPLNIALRKRQKPCASFLLTKQWSKMNYTKKHSIPLNIFVKMKRWADRGRDKAFMLHGQWKSSLKNPRRQFLGGALVGHGVQLDGYSSSKMASKPAIVVKAEQEAEQKRKKRLWNFEEEDKDPNALDPAVYFKSIGMMHSLKLPRLSKWSKMLTKASEQASERQAKEDGEYSDVESKKDGQSAIESKARSRPRSRSNEGTDTKGLKLPPIKEKFLTTRDISVSHQNLTTGIKNEPEFLKGRKGPKTGLVIHTGGTGSVHPTAPPSPTKGSVSSQSVAESVNTKAAKESVTKADSEPPTTITKHPNKKRKQHTIKSAILIHKAKAGDNAMPLPMVSVETSPRPFIQAKNEELTRGTLQLFERYRGIDSRNYAIRCLSVANSFTEKPWLTQVQQAMSIAAKGVKKIVDRKPHLFTSQVDQAKVKEMSASSDSGLEASSLATA